MNRQFPCILKGSYIWLAFDDGNAVTLDSDHGANRGKINFADGAFKNITPEFLANTYGEVKSKEHAEFIKLLAGNCGIPCGHKVVNGDCKYFYVIDGCLFFTHREIDVVGNYKQITIPLPPECEGGPFKNIDADNIETMKFDIQDKMEKSTSTFKPIEITFNVPSGLDISFDTIEQGVLGSDERNLIINVTDNRVYEYDTVDEWPKVGSKALLNNDNDYDLAYGENLIGEEVEVTALFTDGELEMAVVKHDVANYVFRIEMLSKPKTPEEKLHQDLEDSIYDNLNERGFVEAEISIDELSFEITSNLLSKYNITKKGEGDE